MPCLTRIAFLAILLFTFIQQPTHSQNAWTGALEGLAKGLVEIGRERAENERILELERQRAEIWAEQQRNAREQELERQRRAAAAAAAQKARDEERRQLEARQNGGTGSGFFVTDRGHIVTNAHVVGDYRHLMVKDNASMLFEARVVRIDKENDLALLVVDRVSKGLRISPSTADLKGEEVFAIGFPMPGVQGQESKITNGIVSSMSGIKGVETWMQISAAIQGGNSGGPLVTPKGEVVGVVVATVNAKNILERSGSILQNVNYAIKSEYVLEFLRKVSVANQAKPIIGKALKAVDESTVMVFARDRPFSDSFVSKPSDDRIMSLEEREFADYQVVVRDSSVSDIRGYLLKHPTGQHSGEARKLLAKAEKVQWEAARKLDSPAALSEFIAVFSEGIFVEQARSRLKTLDESSWTATVKQDAVGAYDRYLTVFQAGRHRNEASIRIVEIGDHSDWDAAKSEATAAGYEKYMSMHVKGLHIAEAKQALNGVFTSARNAEIEQCLAGELLTWGDGTDVPAILSPLVFEYDHSSAPEWFDEVTVLGLIQKASEKWSQCGVSSSVAARTIPSQSQLNVISLRWSDADSANNFGLANFGKKYLVLSPGAFHRLRSKNPTYDSKETLQMLISSLMGKFFGLRANSRRCVDVTSFYSNGKGEKCVARDIKTRQYFTEFRSSLPTACDIQRCQIANKFSSVDSTQKSTDDPKSNEAKVDKLQLIGQVVEIFPNYGYLVILAQEGISISSSVSIETASNKEIVGRVSKIQGTRASIVVSNEISSIKIGDRVFNDIRNK
jgi:S1-C subfamily serine protease